MIRIPLLKDNHNHLFTYSNLFQAESLFYVKDKTSAIKLLSGFPENKINIAIGWFDTYYNFTSSELNNLPPFIICNNSLHKYLLNRNAQDIINQDYPEWVRNNNDQFWVEKNIMQILSYISGFFQFDEVSFKSVLRKNLEKGVCFASDMFVTSDKIFSFLATHKNVDYSEIWTDPELFPRLTTEHKQVCRGVKLFTDGALGASTAALHEYKTNGNSFLTYTDAEFIAKLEKILPYKTDIAIHCIGDIAIEQVVNSIDLNKSKIVGQEIRLEHVQFINETQAKRAKDLGLVLSMQPNFNMDSVIYSDRLTTQYCESNNPFRMLIDKAGFIPGIDLIFGSDGMPTGIDGTLQESLFPPVPGQKISLDEFVAAYCTDSFDKGFINVHIDQLKKKVITDVEISK